MEIQTILFHPLYYIHDELNSRKSKVLAHSIVTLMDQIAAASGTRTLQIWDTAGQEKYRSLARMYYRSANVAFDIANSESFNAVADRADEIAEKKPSDIQTIIVGNKAGLPGQRVVSKEEDAQQFAYQKGAVYYLECSAKRGDGVLDLFTKAAELIPMTSLRKSDATDLWWEKCH